MVNALITEIMLTVNSDFKTISTIYFGGGTPSLLKDAELQKIMNTIREKYRVDTDAEITLEANPDDITADDLQHWRAAGINRLSIGIQSFFEEELKWMNRAHSSTQAIESILMAKAAGFENFSVDLIYGSPLLTDDQWKKNVQTVIDLKVPHISSYALTVEKGTALDNLIAKKKISAVEQEKQASQFLLLMEWMQQAGYEHYEISNFALPGTRSRHNSSYWKGTPYLGFGPSAHSYTGDSRKWNLANNEVYMQKIESGELSFEEEILTPIQRLNEYVMISLRTMEGIDLKIISDQFGQVNADEILVEATKYLSDKKLILAHDHLILTTEGKLFADGIASDLFH